MAAVRCHKIRPQRPNQAAEEYLAVLLGVATEVCGEVLEAREVDSDPALSEYLRVLHWNLEGCSGAVEGQLLDIANKDTLCEEIDARTYLEPAVNSAEEDQLLRLLGLIRPAAEAVKQLHDAAVGKGHCGCFMCRDAEAIRFNVGFSLDLIGDRFRPIEQPHGISPAETRQPAAPALVDASALVVASADRTVAKRAPATPGPKRPRNYWEPSDD